MKTKKKNTRQQCNLLGCIAAGYDGTCAGAHCGEGVPKLEARIRVGGAPMFGSAPCKGAIDGNCILRI